MTQKELITKWQEEAAKWQPGGFSQAQHERLLKSLCAVVTEAIIEGGEVSLPGIGKLELKATVARTGRNPNTGEPIAIPAGQKVVFKTSSVLKERLSSRQE